MCGTRFACIATQDRRMLKNMSRYLAVFLAGALATAVLQPGIVPDSYAI
jgi:hypothetical protein